MPPAVDELADASLIIGPDDRILVTGASGFIGRRVVERLLALGFRNIGCFARPSSAAALRHALATRRRPGVRLDVVSGNLLSPDDCAAAAQGVAVVFHLAAGKGEAYFADAFMNSVVTTRNIIEASIRHGALRRFVNISSFAVYSNSCTRQARVLDESCPLEGRPASRGDAYVYAKCKQDEIVMTYGTAHGLPYVIVRPGAVYGPGHGGIPARVGIGTFGLFLHLGGANPIPFTYVDNCADAIVLAGLKRGVDGEVFNVVDDELPSSRKFLRLYKRHVGGFMSIYVPHALTYALCWVWEAYARWSEEQLPPVFNRGRWHAMWKKTRYSNERLKARLGWTPTVPTAEGLRRFFESCRARHGHA